MAVVPSMLFDYSLLFFLFKSTMSYTLVVINALPVRTLELQPKCNPLITPNRNVSRREARRINACADGSGGFTGLNTGPRRFGSGPVLPATTTRTIQVGDAVLTIPPPSPSCRPGGGVFQDVTATRLPALLDATPAAALVVIGEWAAFPTFCHGFATMAQTTRLLASSGSLRLPSTGFRRTTIKG